MINPIITHKPITDYSHIGGLICRTPITHKDHLCKLLTSTDDLYEYFGDPYVNPYSYTELVIALSILQNGVPVYISSVEDMYEPNDDFNIVYNGYTEVMFRSSLNYDDVGYKLKSNIKFCQPIIRSVHNNNRLDLYVNLYLLDRESITTLRLLSTINEANLYKTIQITFKDPANLTDEDLINKLSEYGLELKVINGFKRPQALVKIFTSTDHINIPQESLVDQNFTSSHDIHIVERFNNLENFWYNLHTEDYQYGLDTEEQYSRAYLEAIQRLADQKPEPHYICLDKVQHSRKLMSNTYIDLDGSLVTDADEYLASHIIEDVSIDDQIPIQNLVLQSFPDESNSYILFGLRNATSRTIINKLNDLENDKPVLELLENYNADIIFGSAFDYIVRSNAIAQPDKVVYSAALLSFYKLLISDSIYMNNSIVDLNISNKCVRSSLSERSAEKLASGRCNSLVLFDNCRPTIYGDRSLSMLPNLRYSHISRTFVRLRREIREYLETKKFMMNNLFNQQSCSDYISFKILSNYKENGLISDYSISYRSEHQTIYFTIILTFPFMLDSTAINITI